jgi:hypothetical protein
LRYLQIESTISVALTNQVWVDMFQVWVHWASPAHTLFEGQRPLRKKKYLLTNPEIKSPIFLL